MQILDYETYQQNVTNTAKATQMMQQNLDEQVLEIIRAVQERGDEAALAYTKKNLIRLLLPLSLFQRKNGIMPLIV